MFSPPSDKTGITLYGASDDLVEVAGAFREEYDAYDKVLRVTFDTGLVAFIGFEVDGIWRVSITGQRGDETLDVYTGTDAEGDRYTDYLIVPGAASVKVEEVCG